MPVRVWRVTIWSRRPMRDAMLLMCVSLVNQWW